MEADPGANPVKLMAASLLFTTFFILTIFTLLHVIITANQVLILPQDIQKVLAFSSLCCLVVICEFKTCWLLTKEKKDLVL